MTLQELQQKVTDNKSRIAELESSACDHEQKARDARAERATLKLENTELLQQLHNAGTQARASEAVEAAKKSQAAAESNAQQLEAELMQVQNLREELKAKLKELESKTNGDS